MALVDTLSDMTLQEMKETTMNQLIESMFESGYFKDRRDVVRHIQSVSMERLIYLEKYEECAWLKRQLDKLNTKK